MMLKVVCSGSRGWQDGAAVLASLELLVVLEGADQLLVAHGGARGADWFVSRACAQVGAYEVVFQPDWGRFGRSAGHRRNRVMLETIRPAFLLYFWDGVSPGTAGTIKEADKLLIPCVPAAGLERWLADHDTQLAI